MSNEFVVKFRPFDKVECCFDIVAVFGNSNVAGYGNNVERNFVFLTKSKHIEHVLFVSTWSEGRNFVRYCFRNRQRCCQKRQRCRSNIRLCRKNRSTCSIRQCCFDIVAGVDGALRVQQPFLSARRYASTVFAVVACLSVGLSVRHKSELYG